MSLKEKIDLQRLPAHIAIIMDGNGRWARERGQDRLYGHHEGVQSVRDVVEGCAELGVGYLTLYAFSTENWERPTQEVEGIMELLVSTIRQEIDTLRRNHIRLQVIGDVESLPPLCQQELAEAIAITANNDGLRLVMALSYSARWEAAAGQLNPAQIDAAHFASRLSTGSLPDPELLIRTGGEYRISNFLLYQAAYTELFFTETRWPDFRKENLYEALVDYQARERRFGKTSEQIQTNEIIDS